MEKRKRPPGKVRKMRKTVRGEKNLQRTRVRKSHQGGKTGHPLKLVLKKENWVTPGQGIS